MLIKDASVLPANLHNVKISLDNNQKKTGKDRGRFYVSERLMSEKLRHRTVPVSENRPI